jgi:hypothetical protein
VEGIEGLEEKGKDYLGEDAVEGEEDGGQEVDHEQCGKHILEMRNIKS